MVPYAERITRESMIKGEFFYMENVIGDDNQFTMFDIGSIVNVNLLKKSCSCREYDLVKISCAHTMAVLRSKHGYEYGMVCARRNTKHDNSFIPCRYQAWKEEKKTCQGSW